MTARKYEVTPCRPSPVLLRGTPPDIGALRNCCRCGRTVTPAGGVDLTPTEWICGACWKARSGKTSSRMRLLAGGITPLRPKA